MRIKNLVILIFLSFVYQFTNGQTVVDSTKKSKWHHSISLEGQLHNNFIDRRGFVKGKSIYINQIFGDSINESKFQPAFKGLFAVSYNKLSCGIGIDYYKYRFTFSNNNQSVNFFRYKIIGLPIELGGIGTLGKIFLRYYISFIPSLALEEYYYFQDSIGTGTQYRIVLNDLHFGGGYGIDFAYQFFNGFQVFLNFSSRFSIEPIERRYPLSSTWINYSSFNLGLGVKYNFK